MNCVSRDVDNTSFVITKPISGAKLFHAAYLHIALYSASSSPTVMVVVASVDTSVNTSSPSSTVTFTHFSNSNPSNGCAANSI